jgi:hypothetical protein
MGQSDATGLKLDLKDLAAIEEAGASMACSLVKLYQTHQAARAHAG